MTPADSGIIADATPVHLTARASGTAPFRYAWTLGDGNESAEAALDHIYVDEGTYTVSVSVTDADGRTASASRELLARRLDGTWRMRQFGWRYELRQTGNILSGRVIGQDEVEYSGVVPLIGSIGPPNRVSITAPDFTPVGFTGIPSLDLQSLAGTADFVVPRAETLDRTSSLPPTTPDAPVGGNSVSLVSLTPPVGATLREGDTFSIRYSYTKGDVSYAEGLAFIRDDGREFLNFEGGFGSGRLEGETALTVTLNRVNGYLTFGQGHRVDALWVVGPRPLFDGTFAIRRSNVVYSQPIELDYRIE